MNKMITSLMAEYRRAAKDLTELLGRVSDADFLEIKDSKTENKDCQSIQRLSMHIVQSGYTYANYFYSLTSDVWNEYEKEILSTNEAVIELNKMLDYTDKSLNELMLKTNMEIEQYKIESRWGPTFNFEQLFSHAIVHILRHRRQMENFILRN